MIDILLATYNGEKYIKQQILSIISQTYEDWILLVHDDGSTDGTIGVIKSLALIDSRIRLIEDGIKCGSPAKNFLHLLKCSTSEYAMFCDQDDIWFDNKVELMYARINNENNKIPIVVYSNSYCWNPNKGIVGFANGYIARNLNDFLFLNGGIQGCASIFNRQAVKKMQSYNGMCMMHDHLLQFICCSMGKVVYLPIPLMLYRRHSDNVTSSFDCNVSKSEILFKHKSLPVLKQETYKSNIDMIDYFVSDLDTKQKDIAYKYENLIQSSKFNRFNTVLFKSNFTLYGSKLKLIIKMIFRKFID